MPVEVRCYTDPACIWSWGAEPAVRRLMWEFGDELRLVWVMGGLARRYGSEYRDSQGRIGSGRDCFADLMAHWLDVTAETGMPSDPRIWSRNPIASTYPVCQAVKAAAEQGDAAAYAYLRRTREALILERKKLDHVEALVGEAEPAGLDVERFRIDLSSHAITEAFGADLDEVRDVPDDARRADAVSTTEGRERVTFPSMVFRAEGEVRAAVWGPGPYEAYRDAAIAAGAAIANGARPSPEEAVARFGRCATAEIEELTGSPGPVARAELWAAAREWRLRPVPALTGTLWEPA
jgi:predicted DsbA family dithiol-disulfide isomerase